MLKLVLIYCYKGSYQKKKRKKSKASYMISGDLLSNCKQFSVRPQSADIYFELKNSDDFHLPIRPKTADSSLYSHRSLSSAPLTYYNYKKFPNNYKNLNRNDLIILSPSYKDSSEPKDVKMQKLIEVLAKNSEPDDDNKVAELHLDLNSMMLSDKTYQCEDLLLNEMKEKQHLEAYSQIMYVFFYYLSFYCYGIY